MGRVRGYRAGGIVALIGILKQHWGPVGGDLARAHWTWDDVGGGLPFDQFTQMMVYAPPGSAVFYATHKGWDRNTHKLTQLVDIGNWILWSKTEQAQRDPKNPPPPEWRPGDPIPEQKPQMTIGQYMERAGLTDEDLYGGSMR